MQTVEERKAYVKKWKEENEGYNRSPKMRKWLREYSRERRLYDEGFAYVNRQRQKSHHLLKMGKLVKEPCACGCVDVQMHHEDYSKPELVIWLCKPCHYKKHKELEE